jgi:hypothetical protein
VRIMSWLRSVSVYGICRECVKLTGMVAAVKKEKLLSGSGRIENLKGVCSVCLSCHVQKLSFARELAYGKGAKWLK